MRWLCFDHFGDSGSLDRQSNHHDHNNNVPIAEAARKCRKNISGRGSSEDFVICPLSLCGRLRNGFDLQKIYKAQLHPVSPASEHTGEILIKHRFQKQYRHPTLDTTLTKSRVAGEARALIKCLRSVDTFK